MSSQLNENISCLNFMPWQGIFVVVVTRKTLEPQWECCFIIQYTIIFVSGFYLCSTLCVVFFRVSIHGVYGRECVCLHHPTLGSQQMPASVVEPSNGRPAGVRGTVGQPRSQPLPLRTPSFGRTLLLEVCRRWFRLSACS